MASAFEFKQLEWRKLGTSVLIAGTGAIIPIAIQWTSSQEWGIWGPVATAVCAVVVNTIRIWVKDYTKVDPIDVGGEQRCATCGQVLSQ